MKLKLMLSVALALILLVWMAACASSPPKSNPQQAKPTVNCNEHAPLSSAGPVPVPAKDIDQIPPDYTGTDPDRLHAEIAQLRHLLSETRAYAGAEGVFEAKALGVIGQNGITYQAVGTCLDQLRQKGAID